MLQGRGYTFVSETDTEVIAHLVHWEMEQGGTLREAVLRAIPQLRGAYGTVIMDTRNPDTLLAARSGSPLVIGLGMGENFIASDQLALLPVTRRFIFLEEGDIAEVTRRAVTVFDKSGAEVKRQDIESNLQYDAGDKGIYRHYMQKEIYEQPNAIKNTLTGRISHGQVDLSELGRTPTNCWRKSSIFRSSPAVPPTTPGWFLATGLNRWRAYRATWKSLLNSAIANPQCVVTA